MNVEIVSSEVKIDLEDMNAEELLNWVGGFADSEFEARAYTAHSICHEQYNAALDDGDINSAEKYFRVAEFLELLLNMRARIAVMGRAALPK